MAVTTETDELRERLIDTLSQGDLDFDKVQALSTELAKSDPDFVRFSADAAIISRLGRELVARQETAVAELIKNAYDVDAREVTLIFSEADAPGGRLELTDDGSGMTREQLVNGFMRLSSSEKIDEPISPRFERQRAGRKGIGRFAVQRLGRRLTITTQTKHAPVSFQITVDWEKFETGQDLSSVSSRINELSKQKEEGTTLVIDGLREAWDEKSINRVYRYVSELIQPFPLSAKSQSSHLDPGFKINLLREIEGAFDLIADEETEIFRHALAKVDAHVDEKGQGYWAIESDKLGIHREKFQIGKNRNKHDRCFR
ncbi:hypothetical protein BH24DEI2_BH24DEI2_28650 [soil metagenome]